MSVAFGILYRKKKAVENNHFQVMDDALSYWKSDDRGSWNEGSIFLGHRMLWNTPESKLEHLPRIISSVNQMLVITIDARLDNREALAEQLQMADLPLEQITDSDLILAAYQKWGEVCPKYLLGDFVFAIWDANEEHFFCARDHIGIKPFYYHLSDDLFVFSNDIRGVIAHPDVSKKYNDRSIAKFLTGGDLIDDKKDTFYKEIRKLPAATSMTITKKSVTESVYWDIEHILEVHYDTYDEYVEKLRELLLDAVKVRLRTVHPVASHLSGGVDSSSVAVLAARELKKRKQSLYIFNWIETPEGEYDPDYSEWGFATQLAKLENIEQKNIRLTPEFIAEMYDKADISIDDITFFWSEYLVRDEAEKYGARSILSGWGGDELISNNGSAYLRGLFHQGHYIKALKSIAVIYKGRKYKYLRMIKRSLLELFRPFFDKWTLKNDQKEDNIPDPFEYTLEPFSIAAREFSFPYYYSGTGVHNDQKELYKSGHILQRIENWHSSAIGKKIEYSYPLLDRRIVEFALAIPEDLYAPREGHRRFLFRSAIADFLPEHIAWARKSSDRIFGDRYTDLWQESIKIWFDKHKKKIPSNKNSYIDHAKIINRFKIYYTNKKNGLEDTSVDKIVASIMVSNLKNRDG